MTRAMEFLTPAPLAPARFVARFAAFGVSFDSDHLFTAVSGGTRCLITVEAIEATGLSHVLLWFVPLVAPPVRYGIRREIEDSKAGAEWRAGEGLSSLARVLQAALHPTLPTWIAPVPQC